MKFFTYIDRPPKYQAGGFSEYDEVKQLTFDKNGSPILEVVGKVNRYAQIQSHRESCDLSIILSNLDKNQVNGILNSYSVQDLEDSGILDLTSLPKNPGEMLNLVKKSTSYFNGLPLEFRQEFNFSPDKFFSMFGTKDFIDICSKYGINPENHKFFKKSITKKSESVKTDSGAAAAAAASAGATDTTTKGVE